MDARPNVLNKILPCSKRIPFEYITATAGHSSMERLHGRALDPNSDENVEYDLIVPRDIKAGSDLIIMLTVAPLTANNTGSDKKIKLHCSYSVGSVGQVATSPVTTATTLVTIPDGMAANTLMKVTPATIAGLVAGDVLGLRVVRDADHGDDTYTGELWISYIAMAVYNADKIGVT